MTWDPREDGALCDSCPLAEDREGPPVPARWPSSPRALLIGEVPGETETKRGEPFVGKAGQELQAALAAIGIPRSAIALTNVIPCRPPGDATGALDRYLKDLEKRRKREREATKGARGAPGLADPRDCCRPRLLRELARCPNVIPVGGSAFHAVCGGTRGILDARGSPLSAPAREEAGVSVPALRILPTLHPSFVMRKRRWRGAFRADLARAFRWFSTGLDWQDPKGIYAPSPRELRQALEWFARQPFSVFDVETSQGFPDADHFDPLFDKLRCLGIGTADRFVVVPFRSRDPERAPFYYGTDRIEIVRLVWEYLTSDRWRKVSWNGRSYDQAVLKAQLGIREITAHLDAIGLHRLAEPELPHDLGYSGSIFTDVDDWKAGHTATEAQSDEELWAYNAKDLAVTSMTVEPLTKACAAQGQTKNVPFFAKIQDACAEMHRNGMYVDQARRREWDAKLLALAGVQRRKIRELAGWPKLNPNSTPQIRELLFDRLKMLPYSYTDSGDPSTEDDALRAFMSQGWGLDPKSREIVSAIRMYRRQAKRRGVVVKLRPITEGYYEAPDLAIFDESEEEKKERLKRIERGQTDRACGLVLPDGRVHASFNAHGTVGWRIACNKPNVLNLENRLRDMFAAEPGNILVACDEAQLELRMVTGLSGCAYYLDRFADPKIDPHHDLCVDTFGEPYLKMDKDGKKKLRVCVKGLTYAGLYMAGDETKLEILTSAEDDKTETLLFPDFTLREVQAFSRNWHRRCPEIAVWWESVIAEWSKQGYLAEPVMGGRCQFLDGEDPNKMLNFKPQSGGAALAWHAYFRAKEHLEIEVPSARFIHQGYDSLMFECKQKDGEKVKTILEETMIEDGSRYGLPIRFVGEGKAGPTWKDV